MKIEIVKLYEYHMVELFPSVSFSWGPEKEIFGISWLFWAVVVRKK